jgi:hypothetical protein
MQGTQKDLRWKKEAPLKMKGAQKASNQKQPRQHNNDTFVKPKIKQNVKSLKA